MDDRPILRTERLLLDAHRVEDFEDCHAIWSDPVVMRLIAPPSSRHESWTRMLRFAGSWPMLGFGFWAVREAASGRYMGEVGFQDAHRDMTPDLEGVPEIGWVFAAWAQGRGFATEAVLAVQGWSDARMTHPRTVCLIDADNGPSLRLAEKAGYTLWQRGQLGEKTPLTLSRDRPTCRA